MNKTFRLYTIKNLEDGRYFTGVTSSENNITFWLVRQYKEDNKKYTELGESVAKVGFKNHKFAVIKEYPDKDSADYANYNLQLKLKEKNLLINSLIINPEREVCIGCGYKIRKVFMEKHLTYCKKTIVDDLKELLDFDIDNYDSKSEEEYLKNIDELSN